ncbi:MAG: sulfate ABC transporter ATP-binding protein [Alphaproteobacteria bacterium HGW-Alphaproteobacteria-3]|nr:MAG: sulfate ABC transporter ATP-binding protein [Alphaproteobacteria bacterium HGW-Alphaproteobacteria-3]
MHDEPRHRQPVRIDVEELGKSFGSFAALNDVSLTVRPGELLALLGPSGSGKTTLLRAIAGLTATEEGTIRFDGEDATALGLRERRVGFVFQQYALFRHMTVFDNVAFGLRVRPREERPRAGEIARRVRFGALDAKVRKELRRWLRELHTETGLTTIFVTHDQEEALELADRVVVMRAGKIEQIGTPAEIYEEPATPFVCEFLGGAARFEVEAREGETDVLGGTFPIESNAGYSGPAVAYVRAHEIEIVSREMAEGVPAVIRTVRPFGPTITVELSIEGRAERIEADVPRELYDGGEIKEGQGIFIRATSARIFPIG